MGVMRGRAPDPTGWPVPPIWGEVHSLCEMYFCAWCDQEIGFSRGNLRGRPAAQHGICCECLDEQLARLANLPPSRHNRVANRPTRARGVDRWVQGQAAAHAG